MNKEFRIGIVLISLLLVLGTFNQYTGFSIYEGGVLVENNITLEITRNYTEEAYFVLNVNSEDYIKNYTDMFNEIKTGSLNVSLKEFNIALLPGEYGVILSLIDNKTLISLKSEVITLQFEEVVNETVEQNVTLQNETINNETVVNETIGNVTDAINVTLNETVEQNVTLQNGTSVQNLTNEFTLQNGTDEVIGNVRVGEKVKLKRVWKFNESQENLTIELPKDADRIKVEKVENKSKKDITSKVKSNRESKLVVYGRSLYVPEVTAKEEDNTTIEITESLQEVEVQYELPGPVAFESNISEDKKIVDVSSEYHFENVVAFTKLPQETYASAVKVYWLKNNSKEIIQNASYLDTNGNNLIDEIEWVIPHLSNQSFEISIEILNVQSYPQVGDNWEIRFTTGGQANLTIEGSNGTSYGEINNDLSNSIDDLIPLSLKCGSNVLFDKNTKSSSENVKINASGNLVRYNETLNGSFTFDSLYVENYECNETSYWLVNVLTEGVHGQKFTFGDQEAYGYNDAQSCDAPNDATWNITSAILCSNVHNITLNGNLNISSAGTLTLENVTLIFNSTSDGEYGISIEGGSLIVNNSNLTGYNGTNDWFFDVHENSNLILRESNISYIYDYLNIMASNGSQIIENHFAYSETSRNFIKLNDSSDSWIEDNTLHNGDLSAEWYFTSFRAVFFLTGYGTNNTLYNNTINFTAGIVDYNIGLYIEEDVTGTNISYNDINPDRIGSNIWIRNVYFTGNADNQYFIGNSLATVRGHDPLIDIETDHNVFESNNFIDTETDEKRSGYVDYPEGIYLDNTFNNTFRFNNLTRVVMTIIGTTVDHFNHTIDLTNVAGGSVDFKPVLYLKEEDANTVVENNDTLGAIILGWTRNITINNVTMNNVSGVYIYDSKNITLANSSFRPYQAPQAMFYTVDSDNVRILNNYIENNNAGGGIRNFFILSNSEIRDNNITYMSVPSTSGSRSFFILTNSNFTNNTFTQSPQDGAGIEIYEGSNSLIEDNSFYSLSGGQYHLFSISGTGHTIRNNRIINPGIYFHGEPIFSTTYSRYENNSIDTGTYSGTNYEIGTTISGSNNNFSGNFFNDSWMQQGSDIAQKVIISGSNNRFTEDWFRCPGNIGTGGSDTLYECIRVTGANNVFENVTHNQTNVSFSGSGNLNVSWYADIYINRTDSDGVSNVNVSIYDSNAMIISNNLTESGGNLTRQLLQEYMEDTSGRTYYTNYTITGVLDGYSTGNLSYNLTTMSELNLQINFIPVINYSYLTTTHTNSTFAYTNDTIFCNVSSVYDEDSSNYNFTVIYYNQTAQLQYGINNYSELNGSYSNKTALIVCGVIVNDGINNGTQVNSTNEWRIDSSEGEFGEGSFEGTNYTVESDYLTPNPSSELNFTSDIVGFWRFENITNGANDTHTVDETGVNNGTIIGSTYTSDAQIGNYAMQFDGDNDYVSTNLDYNAVNSSFTFIAWIKPKNVTTAWEFFIGSNGVTTGLTKGHFSDEVVLWTTGLSDDQLSTSGSPLQVDTWTFAVGTYNGSVKKIYIDGVINAQEDSTGELSNGLIYIGTKGGQDWNGSLDSIMIINRSLTSQEISELYEIQKVGKDYNYTGTNYLYNNTQGNYTSKILDIGSTGNLSVLSWINLTDGGEIKFQTRTGGLNGSNYLDWGPWVGNNGTANGTGVYYLDQDMPIYDSYGNESTGNYSRYAQYRVEINGSYAGPRIDEVDIKLKDYKLLVLNTAPYDNFSLSVPLNHSYYNYNESLYFNTSEEFDLDYDNLTSQFYIYNSSVDLNRIPGNESLIGYWRMDKNDVVFNWPYTIVKDVVGENHGVMGTNQVQCGNVSGYSFEGCNFPLFQYTNTTVAIPYSTSLDNINMTIAFWMNVDTFSYSSDIIARSNDFRIGFWTDNRIRLDGNQIGITVLSADEWYYVTLTRSGTNVTLYLDGEIENSTIGTEPTFLNNIFFLGGRQDYGAEFNGTLDEVMYFNTTLNQSQIGLLYNEQTPYFKTLRYENSSINNEINITDINFTEQTYYWRAKLNDTDNLTDPVYERADSEYSVTKLFTVDITNPNITSLDWPGNGTHMNVTGRLFNFSLREVNADSCKLYGTWNGGWHDNKTIKAYNGSNSFEFIGIADAWNYTWGVWCNDSAGNSIVSHNYTVTIDTGTPTLIFENITDSQGNLIDNINRVVTGNDITFYINVSDALDNVQSVIIKIWDTVRNGAVWLYGVFSDLGGGLWSFTTNVNETWILQNYNYTIFVNDTAGNLIEYYANFSINHDPYVNYSYISADAQNPLFAYTNSTLVCNNGTSGDEDQDNVTFIYEWYKNDELYSMNQTIGGNDINRGDVIYCTTTSYDGTQNGTLANSTKKWWIDDTQSEWEEGSFNGVNSTAQTGSLTLHPSGSLDYLKDNLVAYYTFENISGIEVKDEIGMNNATLNVSTCSTGKNNSAGYVAGKFGNKALKLESAMTWCAGTNAYIRVNFSDSLNFTDTGFTVIYWTRVESPDAMDANTNLFTMTNSSTVNFIRWYARGWAAVGILVTSTSTGSFPIKSADVTEEWQNYINQEWHMMALSFPADNSNVTMFKDGTDFTDIDTKNRINETLEIGVDGYYNLAAHAVSTAGVETNVTVDSYMILNRSMSSDELNLIYKIQNHSVEFDYDNQNYLYNNTQGNYTSKVIDIGSYGNLTELTFGNYTYGGNISLQTRTGWLNYTDGIEWGDWVGNNGTANGTGVYYLEHNMPIYDGANRSAGNVSRFLQYRVELDGGYGGPILNEVKIKQEDYKLRIKNSKPEIPEIKSPSNNTYTGDNTTTFFWRVARDLDAQTMNDGNVLLLCDYNENYCEEDSNTSATIIDGKLRKGVYINDSSNLTYNYSFINHTEGTIEFYIKHDWFILNYTEINRTELIFEMTANVSGVDYNGTSVNDSSGFGNNGTFNGGAHGNSSGKIGDGMYFDGDDDSVIVTYPSGFLTPKNMTVSVWFKPNVVTNSRLIDTSNINQQWYIRSNGRVSIYNGTDSREFIPSTLPVVNEWSHIVFTISNGTLESYLNGDLVINDNLVVPYNPSDNTVMRIGARAATGGTTEEYNGSIDQIRIWNRTLTQKELSNLYQESDKTMNNNTLYLLDSAESESKNRISIYKEEQNLSFTIDNKDDIRFKATTSINDWEDDVWYYITAFYKNKSMELYVDEILKDSADFTSEAILDDYTLLREGFESNASIESNLGTLVGGNLVVGRHEIAFEANDSDSYILYNETKLNTSLGTIEFYIRPGFDIKDNLTYYFFDTGWENTSNRISIFAKGGNLTFEIRDKEQIKHRATTDSVLNAGTWYQVGGTWNQSNITLYLDREIVAGDAGTDEHYEDQYTLFLDHLDQKDIIERNDGTVRSGAFLDGKYGEGYLADNNDENILFSTTNNFNRTSGTIEFWFMPYFNGTDSGTNYFFDLETGAINNYRIYRVDNLLIFAIVDSLTSVHTATSDITNWDSTIWQHVAVTYNATSMHIYNNNSLIGSYTNPIDLSTNSLSDYFNVSNINSGGNPANGVIDDIRISNFERIDFNYQRNVNLSLNESSDIYLLRDREGAYTGNATIDSLRISNVTRTNFTYQNALNLNSNVSSPVHIGSDYNSSYQANATIDDLRISSIVRRKDFSFINYNESVVHEFYLSSDANFSTIINARVSINNFSNTKITEDVYTLHIEHFDSIEKIETNNGTIYSTPTITEGKFGTGLLFDNTNEYVRLSNETIRYDKGTVEFWINPEWDYDEQENYFVSWTDSLFSNYLYIYHANSNITFEVNDGSSKKATTGISWNSGEWHHLAIAYNNNSGVRIYVDGNLSKDTSMTWSVPDDLNPYYDFGKKGSSTTNGTIDELKTSRIDYYTPDELYNNTFTLPSELEDGIYYWKVRGVNLFNRSLDNESIYSDFSEVNTLTIDTTVPIVTLMYPEDITNHTTLNETNFTFSVIDNSLASCNLYGNWSGSWILNQTINSPSSGVNNFSRAYVEDGRYAWNVYCSDSAGNSAYATSNFTFILDRGAPTITEVNLTDSNGDIINSTNAITSGDVLNIRITLDEILTLVDKVWVTIWETIKGGAKLFEGFLTNIGGNVWEVNVTTNITFNQYTNYTIYTNDTLSNLVEYDGNFSVNHYPEFGLKRYENRDEFILGTFSNTINNTYSSTNYNHDNITLLGTNEGNFTSNLIDFGENVSLVNLSIEFDAPDLTYINLSYSLGNNITLVNTTFTDTNETFINLEGNESRYFRFQVNLYNYSAGVSPTVYSIRVNYKIKNLTVLNSWQENSILINLTEYFNDRDGDLIIYSVEGASNLSIVINNALLNITNSKGYLGTEHLTILANDSKIVTKSSNFTVSIRELRTSMIINSSVDPDSTMKAYGFVNETDNTSYWTVADTRIYLHIDNETVKQTYTETNATYWDSGTVDNITTGNSLSLQTEATGWTLYEDDFSQTNFSIDSMNYSNVGNLTSSGIIFFQGETSTDESYVIYQFNDTIGFSNASAFMILDATFVGTNNASIYYSFNESLDIASFTQLGSSATASETVGGYIDATDKTTFMVKINTTGGGIGVPSAVTYFNTSYEPKRYRENGTFTSQIINLTDSFDQFSKIYWNSNETNGNIRVETRSGNYWHPTFYSDSSLVGRWEFEEGTGTNAIDKTGINNGTITSATYDSSNPKLGDYAMGLDGDNDYITIANDITLRPTEITISFWTKISSKQPSGYPAFVDRGNNGGWWIYLNSGEDNLYWQGDSGQYVIISSPPKDEWIHIVATGTNETLNLYMNGNLEDTDSKTYTVSSGVITIGQQSGTQFLNGSMDSVMIFNKTLTAQEISNLYNQTRDNHYTWTNWSNNEDESELNSTDNQFLQYRAIFNTINVSHTPLLNEISIKYAEKIYTNANSYYEYNFSAPNASSLGLHMFKVNSTSNTTAYGENETEFSVESPTSLSYHEFQDYSSSYCTGDNAPYNVTVNTTRTDTDEYAYTKINISVYNSTAISSKVCDSTLNCNKIFCIGDEGGSDLGAGDYTVLINSSNYTAYYRNQDESFSKTLNAKKGTAQILAPIATVADLGVDDVSVYVNITLVNRGNTPLNDSEILDPQSGSHYDPTYIRSVDNLTRVCGTLNANANCTEEYNITLIGNSPSGDRYVVWRASWTEQDSSTSQATPNNTMYVDVLGNPAIWVSSSLLNITDDLSQDDISQIYVNSTGNEKLITVQITINNNTFPGSWIDLFSSDGSWDDANERFDDIGEDATPIEGVILSINTSIDNFTAAHHTGNISIIASQGPNWTINYSIYVNPESNLSEHSINNSVEHGTNINYSFNINATGNVKLENVNVSFVNESLNFEWLIINETDLMNITEGEFRNLSFSVNIPEFQAPGNYNGTIYINYTNLNYEIVLVNITVDTNSTWFFDPAENISKSFDKNAEGEIGNFTINNTGNIGMNFTLTYEGDVTSLVSNAFTEDYTRGVVTNPTAVYVEKNSTETVVLWWRGHTNTLDNEWLNITITNSSGNPTSMMNYRFINVTNSPPNITSIIFQSEGFDRNYTERNYNITIKAVTKDDSQIDTGTAIYNIEMPNGTNLNFTPSVLQQDGTIRNVNFTYSYDAPIGGTYSIKVYVDDNDGATGVSNFSYFVAYNFTNLTATATSITVANMTQANDKVVNLTFNVSNIGFARAYSIAVSGNMSETWTIGNTVIDWNLTSQNSTTLNVNVTVPTATIGTYYFTPIANWTDPSGANQTHYGSGVSITATSHPAFELLPSDTTITVEHGESLLMSFLINATGNNNISTYSVSNESTSNGLVVAFTPTTGSSVIGNAANVTINVSVDDYASSGNRQFTVVVDGAVGYSENFIVTVGTSANNSFTVKPDNITINEPSEKNNINTQINITHDGTSNTVLNFVFNLTGNLTSIANILNSSLSLTGGQIQEVTLNYTTPAETTSYYGNLTINETNTNALRYVDLYLNSYLFDIQIINITPNSSISSGDLINATVNVSYAGALVHENSTFTITVNDEACTVTMNYSLTNYSIVQCQAPDVGSSLYNNYTMTATYVSPTGDLVNSATLTDALTYTDVTPPLITAHNASTVALGNLSTINLTATDNSNVGTALARIDFPNGTTHDYEMSNVLGNDYNFNFNTSLIGIYNVTYIVNDSVGNINNTIKEQFEIYQHALFSGYILDLLNVTIDTTFTVYESGTNSVVHNFTTNGSGYYSQSIIKRPYDFEIVFLNFTIKISGVDFNTLPNDFIDLDRLATSDVNLENPVKGFSIAGYFPKSANITMSYVDGDIGTSEDYLQLFTCLNWTYNTRTCQSNWWVQVPASLNKIQNLFLVNISSLSNNATSYFIAESVPPNVAEMELPSQSITTSLEHNTNVTRYLDVQSAGNSPVLSVVFTCESGTACESLKVTSPRITSIPVGFIHSAPVNITAPRGVDPGIYTGVFKVTSENENKDVTLTITVPENKSWIYIPEVASITTGGNTNSTFGSIYLNNTGNVYVNFTFDSNESYVYPIDSAINLSKQDNTSTEFRYYTPNEIGKTYIVFNITGGGITREINVTLNVTHIINIITVSPSSSIEANDQLSISATANYSGIIQTTNMTWSASIGSSSCSNASASYDGTNSKWDITCFAPNITSIANRTLRLTGLFTNYSVVAYDVYNITYEDIFAPIISNYTDSAPYSGNITPINITVIEDSGLSSAIVVIMDPSGSTIQKTITQLEGSIYNFSSNFTEVGDYTFNFTLTDTEGNILTTSESFEIYNLMNFSGIVERSNGSGAQVNFTLYKNGTGMAIEKVITDDYGIYSSFVRNRTYDLVIDAFGFSVTLSNVTLGDYSYDPINLDEMDLQKVGVASTRDIKGLAVNSTINNSGSISVAYNTDEIENSQAVSLYECQYFNYSLLTCDSNFTKLENQERLFGSNSVDITTFYSYLLTELTQEVEVTVTSPSVTVTTSGGGGGGGGGGGISTRALTNLESLIKGIALGKQEVNGIEVDVNPIARTLYQGEESSVRIKIASTVSDETQISATVDGDVKGLVFIENPVMNLPGGSSSNFDVKVFIPFGTQAGNYDGTIVISSGEDEVEVPVNIRVLKSEEKLLDVKVTPVTEFIKPGDDLRMHVDLFNLGKEKRVDVQLVLEFLAPESEDVLNKVEEAIAVETTISVIKKIKIPDNTPLGKYIVRATAYYSNNDQNLRASSIAYIDVEKSIWDYTFLGLRIANYAGFSLIVGFGWGIYFFYLYQRKRKKRYIVKVDLKNLPQPGPRSGFVGKIAETDIRSFIDIDKLQTHTLIAGSTGSGKSITAQDIAEEVLKKKGSVIVFDPTAQWSGFLRKCTEKGMIARYKFFNMKGKDARAFSGNIRIVENPNEAIDLTKYMNPGEITVFSMHKLDVQEIDTIVANTIQQIFKANLEESKKLRALIVYDEVHRLLPKFGGSGDGLIQLERGAREFRKWGVGLMLISQVLTDFVGEIKANIGTEVQMRTRYEGDLERIEQKYGDDSVKSLIKSTIGTGMVENSEYNRGRPYFVTFRPIQHSVTRLENEELENYKKYNDIMDELKDSVDQLKALKVDIFDLELELKLAMSKVRTGQFNIVEIYLESLKPKVDEAWNKIGKKPVKYVRKLVNTSEINKSVQEGRTERKDFKKEDVNEKAKEYIKQALQKNVSDMEIIEQFKKAGWPEEKTKQIIQEVKGGP